MYYTEEKKKELVEAYYNALVREEPELAEQYAIELYEVYGYIPKKIW